MEMNPYGYALTGAAVQVEIGFLAAKNAAGLHDALVIVTGAPAFTAGIDKKVLFCQSVQTGRDQTLTYSAGGQTRNLVRGQDGWKFGELYLGGQSIKLKLDEGLTSQVRPLHMVTAYNQRFESAPAKINIDRRIKEIESELKGKGWSGTIAVDWADKGSDAEARTSLNAVVEAITPVFTGLLADAMGKEAMAAIKTLKLKVTPGVSLDAAKAGNEMTVTVGTAYGSDGVTAALQSALEKNL